jgi:hypothetical protein
MPGDRKAWTAGGRTRAEFQGEDVLLPGPRCRLYRALSRQFGYTFNYNSRYNYRDERFDRNLVQSLNVNGTINLTPKWRLGFRSGYDFERKEITYTSVDLYRDLHCWEMTLNWIPFGFRKSYNLTIRVKSQMLQDLKVTKRTHHLDNAFQTF